MSIEHLSSLLEIISNALTNVSEEMYAIGWEKHSVELNSMSALVSIYARQLGATKVTPVEI